MKALADENFPRAAVMALRQLGWDVACVQERAPAITDREVIALALSEGRKLLTFDKDFGDLSRAYPDAAVVLFRLPRLTLAETVARIVETLATGCEGSEGFWVVDTERVRFRKA